MENLPRTFPIIGKRYRHVSNPQVKASADDSSGFLLVTALRSAESAVGDRSLLSSFTFIVLLFHHYYDYVRLPDLVHAERAVTDLLPPSGHVESMTTDFGLSRVPTISIHACNGSMTAECSLGTRITRPSISRSLPSNKVRTLHVYFAAQYRACIFPCQRLTTIVTDSRP